MSLGVPWFVRKHFEARPEAIPVYNRYFGWKDLSEMTDDPRSCYHVSKHVFERMERMKSIPGIMFWIDDDGGYEMPTQVLVPLIRNRRKLIKEFGHFASGGGLTILCLGNQGHSQHDQQDWYDNISRENVLQNRFNFCGPLADKCFRIARTNKGWKSYIFMVSPIDDSGDHYIYDAMPLRLIEETENPEDARRKRVRARNCRLMKAIKWS